MKKKVTNLRRISACTSSSLEIDRPSVQGNIIDDVFADQPWRVLLSPDAYEEVKQLGGTQQKASGTGCGRMFFFLNDF